MQDLFGDQIIVGMTRKQALQAGEQVLLDTKLSKEAGIKFPVYMTYSAWNIVQMAVANEKHCNDLEGVLWDIFTMFKYAAESANSNRLSFSVIITGVGRKRYHNFVAMIGPSDIDDPSAAITIMLPDED